MRLLTLVAALALAGCATSYQISLMPRDSGKMYYGTADDNGNGEGRMAVTIEDKVYNGTWVATSPDRTTAYVSGGFGWGRRGGAGVGGIVTMDNPQGGEAKALLATSDGSGLRCDLRSGQGRGGGVCRDDRGREYDVQLRAVARQ
jgi:hypothetical protein